MAVTLGADGRRDGRRCRSASTVVVLAASAVGSAALAHGAAGSPIRTGSSGAVCACTRAPWSRGASSGRSRAWRGIPAELRVHGAPVASTRGATSASGSSRRSRIPSGAAASLPGLRRARTWRAMRAYPHLAVLTAMVHDETSGEVDARRRGRPVLRYAMTRGGPGAAREGARGVRATAARGGGAAK